MVKGGEGRCRCTSGQRSGVFSLIILCLFLSIIPIFDLVSRFFVSSNSYTLDFFRFATFFFFLRSFRFIHSLRLQATWKSPCLEGGTWSSGSLPTSPAISRDVSRDTSVDRRSCCRQIENHLLTWLSLLCPSLRSLWTLISTLGPLQRDQTFLNFRVSKFLLSFLDVYC